MLYIEFCRIIFMRCMPRTSCSQRFVVIIIVLCYILIRYQARIGTLTDFYRFRRAFVNTVYSLSYDYVGFGIAPSLNLLK